MSDRELLQKAAKAIHAKPDEVANDGTHWFGRSKWNPLTDDGDALRLAVKLAIEPRRFSDWVSTGTERTGANSAALIQEPLYPDPYAATRRAIVRAAAEIYSRSSATASTNSDTGSTGGI